jgi:hypothetical protein
MEGQHDAPANYSKDVDYTTPIAMSRFTPSLGTMALEVEALGCG